MENNIKCSSCKTMKDIKDFYNMKNQLMKCCFACRIVKSKIYSKKEPKDYSNKIKCYRCQCYRDQLDFIKGDRPMKSCSKCRALSRNHMKKNKLKIQIV